MRRCDLEIFAEVARIGTLDRCHFPFGNSKVSQGTDDLSEISYLEMSGTPIDTSHNWISSVDVNFTVKQFKSDWEFGHFHRRTLMYSSPAWGFDDGTGFVYMETDAYSVEIEADALKRLLGLTIETQDTASQGRNTKFDWEAAFADVAVRFYHDIEFDDLQAKGVQTDIIDMLRASFEARGLAVPSDDTLKPKARKLLGALRARKP